MEFLVDLHVHSAASPCSSLHASDIVRDARAAGIGGVALVEHEVLPPAATVDAVASGGIAVYPGIEIDSGCGDVLVFGVDREPPARLAPLARIQWLLQRGATAVLAHPFRANRPAEPALWRLPAVAVETYNGRCTHTENGAARNAAWARGRPAVAGSDAHRPGEIGAAVTVFPRRPADPEDLAALLRCGACRPLALGDTHSPRSPVAVPA